MIDDPVLPAAAHLTGEHAIDVLGAAIDASGATLLACRPVNVQYRPGSDLIVRYSATVQRSDGSTARETLLAGTTHGGPHPGTVPVESTTADGRVITAGVWRWPYDPVLADLGQIASPARARTALGDLMAGPLHVEVVVYRPCERVVVRVTDADGTQLYVKLVAPAAVAPLVDRHVQLGAAGLPVPFVLAAGPSWLAMSAVHGATLRDALKGTVDARWPTSRRFVELSQRLQDIDLSHHAPVRRRLDDAAAHAAMLASVHPPEAARLASLAEHFRTESARTADRARTTVHGDLHEGQLIIADGRITGLIDIDDAGPGDPIDDLANLLGHVRFRALTSPGRSTELAAYADALHRELIDVVDPHELAVATAAVLTGLATGPFRIQQPGWRDSVTAVLDVASSLVDADERTLSTTSSTSHARPTPCRV